MHSSLPGDPISIFPRQSCFNYAALAFFILRWRFSNFRAIASGRIVYQLNIYQPSLRRVTVVAYPAVV